MRPLLLTLCFMLCAGAALAATPIHPGGFPTPVGPVAEQISWLYNVMFIIVAAISVVVVVPILYILYKYRRDKVQKPATFSHSTILEVTWTVIPALICLYIAVESYKAMVDIRTMPEDAMNVEVVAYQFGWDFYYPDASENGTHVAAAEPTGNDPEVSLPDYPRQTKELVVPAGKKIVLHVTASDVIHSMFIPHTGVKIDAVPGRINYAWFMIPEPGSYLGQCTELCGQAHGEMFFRVTAVTPAEFETYIQERRVAAGLPAVPTPASVSNTLTLADTISGTSVVTPTMPTSFSLVTSTVAPAPTAAPVAAEPVTVEPVGATLEASPTL